MFGVYNALEYSAEDVRVYFTPILATTFQYKMTSLSAKFRDGNGMFDSVEDAAIYIREFFEWSSGSMIFFWFGI